MTCLLEFHGIGAVRVCLGGLQLCGFEFGGLLALSAIEGQLTDSKLNVDAAAHNPLKKSKIERAMPPAVEPMPSRSAFHAELSCSTECTQLHISQPGLGLVGHARASRGSRKEVWRTR